MASRAVVACLWLALAAVPAQATNGYFAHGYSAAQRGQAGAATALADDAFAATINPAMLTDVGRRLDINLTLFSPIRDFTTTDAQVPLGGAGILQVDPIREERSENELFLIPGIAYSHPIDANSAWGIIVYGNGGLNTRYKNGPTATLGEGLSVAGIGATARCDGVFGSGQTLAGIDPLSLCGNGASDAGVDLIQLFIAPTYARRFGDFRLGISPLIVGQRFQATGLAAFARFSESPDHVTNKGTDLSFGGGARFGIAYDPASWLRLGVSYQTRIHMTPFDEYKGLFTDQGDFDIPSSFNVGLAWTPAARHTLATDFQRINFSEIAAVGDPLDPNEFVKECARPRLLGLGTERTAACLGGDDGPGFGWDDVTVFKFGYRYAGPNWTLRLGYSNNRHPIQSDQVLFNILAPAVPEEHFTAGLTWHYSSFVAFDLALMHAADNPVRGKNPLSNVEGGILGVLAGTADYGSDPADQDIELNMRQFELTFGVNFTFDE